MSLLSETLGSRCPTGIQHLLHQGYQQAAALDLTGDFPNVTFPCAALYDPPAGRIAIYYGAADTVTALAFAKLDEVLLFLRSNSEV